jgi:hypothetical protein
MNAKIKSSGFHSVTKLNELEEMVSSLLETDWQCTKGEREKNTYKTEIQYKIKYRNGFIIVTTAGQLSVVHWLWWRNLIFKYISDFSQFEVFVHGTKYFWYY